MKQLEEAMPSTRVLIVDDEPIQLESLKELVTLSGYQAEATSSGMNAIDYLKNYTFEVMLLDLNMPDLSGYSIIDFHRTQTRCIRFYQEALRRR
jgi:CheY-like chemotaxis protein